MRAGRKAIDKIVDGLKFHAQRSSPALLEWTVADRIVMPGPAPGIHVSATAARKSWMAGTSPAMDGGWIKCGFWHDQDQCAFRSGRNNAGVKPGDRTSIDND